MISFKNKLYNPNASWWKMNLFRKQNKSTSLYIGIGVIVLIIIAFLGYALERSKVPVRVSFATKGGGIIFDHQYHVQLKDSKCQECHHNYKPDTKAAVEMNCRTCHYSRKSLETCSKENIHKRCIGKNCTDCHVTGSVNCEFCHNAESFPEIVEPKLVKFETDGGLVVFDHFKHASPDEYDLGCDECHHGYKPEKKKTFVMSCRRCHYNTKYEKICENADTHVRCIGKNCLNCHEEGKENCEMCHKEE